VLQLQGKWVYKWSTWYYCMIRLLNFVFGWWNDSIETDWNCLGSVQGSDHNEPEPNLAEPEPEVQFKVQPKCWTEPKVRFRVWENSERTGLNRTCPSLGRWRCIVLYFHPLVPDLAIMSTPKSAIDTGTTLAFVYYWNYIDQHSGPDLGPRPPPRAVKFSVPSCEPPEL